MTIDWTAFGGYAAAIVSGAAGWWAGRGKRSRDAASNEAAVSEFKADATVNDAATAQIKLLLERVAALEAKCNQLWDAVQAEKEASAKLRDRVRLLEGILRDNHIEVPPEK